MKKTLLACILGFSVLVAAALPTMAQQQGGGGAPAGGGGFGGGGGGGFGGAGGGGAGGFDPAQIRQFQLDNAKMQLGATDDEWKVMSPKLEKVITLQTQLQAGRRGGRGGFGGGGGGGAGRGAPADPTNPVSVASVALTTAVANTAATPEDLTGKLKELRDAKTKVQKDLTTAQDDLKKIATVRQEAVLVTLGYLD